MSLLIPGLVSITFRALSPLQIIDLMIQGGLKMVEWGGDIHVPPGHIERAKEVRRWTEEAGLQCAAYGSYYRLGPKPELSFAEVVETAVALGAPTIRLWAGSKGSMESTEDERRAIVEDAQRVALLAQAHGVTVSLEYHAGTLTDTRESVRRLMMELAGTELKFLWQPAHGEKAEDNVARLREILPRLGHVHIFHWWPGPMHRRPLEEGEEGWKQYLALLRGGDLPVPCLLEFVRDDSAEQFLRDAATLRHWLSFAQE